jgi:DNA repair protein RadC
MPIMAETIIHTDMEYIKGNMAEVEITYKTKVKPSERYKVTSSGDCYKLFLTLFDDGIIEHHEQMIILCLNRANKVLGYSLISQGGVSGTVVDPKIIFQIALKTNASSIIIAHNHPSGLITPSETDNKITQKIKNAGELLEIKLLDHLILSSEGYYSYADEGEIF